MASNKHVPSRIALRMKALGVSSVEQLAEFSPEKLKARNFGRTSIRAVYQIAGRKYMKPMNDLTEEDAPKKPAQPKCKHFNTIAKGSGFYCFGCGGAWRIIIKDEMTVAEAMRMFPNVGNRKVEEAKK